MGTVTVYIGLQAQCFSEGTQGISRHRLHKVNLFVLREVWRDTSLWKHNLNCALEIRIELAACKAYSCIHQERLQVPWVNVLDKNGSYWNRLPVQPNQDLMMSKARNVNWCGENNSLFSLSEPKHPAQGQLSAAQRDMRVPDGLNTKGIWYTHSAEGFFHYSLIQWSLAWQRHLDWKGD